MAKLELTELVGKGLHRECYAHPDNPDLCVKVMVVAGGEAETIREQSYYKLLQKKDVAWDMLPKFHGTVETNLGSGAIFDLIKDPCGNTSKTLRQYLESETLNKLNEQGLQQHLQNLKAYLITQNIMTMTIKPKNIVYQKRENQDDLCVIIDNIGNSDFIRISSHNRYFGRKKIERKWARFIAKMENTY